MTAFFVCGVLFSLTAILLWMHGTRNMLLSKEEDVVMKIAIVLAVVPLLNYMSATLLYWHILKRMRLL